MPAPQPDALLAPAGWWSWDPPPLSHGAQGPAHGGLERRQVRGCPCPCPGPGGPQSPGGAAAFLQVAYVAAAGPTGADGEQWGRPRQASEV